MGNTDQSDASSPKKETNANLITAGDFAGFLREAEEVEDSNEVKVLYQVLLEEYRELKIITEEEYADLKKLAVAKIAERLHKQEWRGPQNIEKRGEFRFEMLVAIRKTVHRAAARKFHKIFGQFAEKFAVAETEELFPDRRVREFAVKLATLRELKDELTVRRAELQAGAEGKKIEVEEEILEEIYMASAAFSENQKKAFEEELEELKHREILSTTGAALCLSGGGIRSATFGLGVLQGLAKHHLLDKFSYLSTVSGGGYIGSWLSAWIHRAGVEEVREKLNFKKTAAGEIEPPEITHLRSYSNYMSPRPGLFSIDTWTLITVYLRNLLLNWTVFIPLLAAILLLPKLFVSLFSLDSNAGLQWTVFGVATLGGLVGVLNINAMRPSLTKYSWVDQTYKSDNIGTLKSAGAKVFKWVLAWILLLAFGITLFRAWNRGAFHLPLSAPLANLLKIENLTLVDFVLFGLGLLLGGYFLAWILMLPRFVRVSKNEKEEKKRGADYVPKNESLWEKFKRIYKIYFSEPVALIFSGAIGGALLYAVVENVSHLSAPVYRVFPNIPENTVHAWLYVCFGAPLFLVVFLLSAAVFVGFAVRFTDDEDREWLARFGALILAIAVGWSILSSAVIFGPELFKLNLNGFEWLKPLLASVGGISGLITLILGFSNHSSAKDETGPKGGTGFLLWFAPAVAAPIFVLFLVVSISYLTQILTDNVKIFSTFNQTAWFVALLVVGSVMGAFININKFSFHSIYRERLIRAYLGASRTKKRLLSANSFTGLDTVNDNIQMSRLLQKPFHVVNMTLNLVKTDNLRWQNRKAESFTATALHCGSSNMGEGSGNYRKSESYGLNKQNGRAITLGTAAAISGAAASPNMGYYTMSSAVSFLMVLFNVRLGWWLGNPGKRGDLTYHLASPRWSPRLFFEESFGKTDDTHPYVYLSDGGHFENLGLYEMVLRRCHLIVVSDAGCDSDFGFSDFGTAIHKIRVDMRIPIEFEPGKLPVKKRNCAIGRIKYKAVDGETAEDGILIYIKPTLDDDEPVDIKNYVYQNPDFPHESTGDQMYSEAQFESYRSLGFHMMDSICCRQTVCTCQNLSNLESHAKNYLSKVSSAAKT